MSKVYTFLSRYAFFTKTEEYLKSVHIGESKITLHTIVSVFLSKISNQRLIAKADSIAFNFIAAIFPGIIFLFTLIPYIPVPNLGQEVITVLNNEELFPKSIASFFTMTVDEIISKPRGGLLSFGFFLSLYLATNGMSSLMGAFNSSYSSVERRSPVKRKLTAVLLTVMLVFVLVGAIATFTIGKMTTDMLIEKHLLGEGIASFTLKVVDDILLIVMFFIAISLIYFIAPSVKRRWRFISPGSFIATFLCITFTFLFSKYVNNFANYDKVYGSVGALIALMFWWKFIALTLLVGFEVNASIDLAKERHKKNQ